MYLIIISFLISFVISAPITNEQGMNYLMNFGYTNNKSISAMSDKEVKESIGKFQAFTNISVTGILDKETKKKMAKPRCKMPDIRLFEYLGRWNYSQITYKFANFPDRHFNESITKSIMKTAMRLWLQRINLVVKEEHDIEKHPNIIVSFTNNTELDGMTGILGRADPPEKGNIIFLYENIVENDVNIYYVAAHEFGHVLGLNHIHDSTSIMYPMYEFTGNYKPKLNALDIEYIEKLYGRKYNPCQDGSIDAAVSINYSIYILRGIEVWKYSSGKLQFEYPKVLQEQFPGLRNRVNASFYYNNILYFIQGKQVFKFDGKRIQPFDTLELDFQAAVTIEDRLYTFKGSQYWRYDINDSGMTMVKKSFPKKISALWKGVPDDIDAVYYHNGDVYFFKGRDFYKFDIHASYYNNAEKSPISNWVGCGK